MYAMDKMESGVVAAGGAEPSVLLPRSYTCRLYFLREILVQ
jgi:hypothetical protein